VPPCIYPSCRSRNQDVLIRAIRSATARAVAVCPPNKSVEIADFGRASRSRCVARAASASVRPSASMLNREGAMQSLDRIARTCSIACKRLSGHRFELDVPLRQPTRSRKTEATERLNGRTMMECYPGSRLQPLLRVLPALHGRRTRGPRRNRVHVRGCTPAVRSAHSACPTALHHLVDTTESGPRASASRQEHSANTRKWSIGVSLAGRPILNNLLSVINLLRIVSPNCRRTPAARGSRQIPRRHARGRP